MARFGPNSSSMLGVQHRSHQSGARATRPVAGIGKRHDVVGALPVGGVQGKLVAGPASEDVGPAHITDLIGLFSRRKIGISDPSLLGVDHRKLVPCEGVVVLKRQRVDQQTFRFFEVGIILSADQ